MTLTTDELLHLKSVLKGSNTIAMDELKEKIRFELERRGK